MAKPDLEQGYLRIAHELHAALACAGFGRDEQIIIHEAFAMIYGPALLKEFQLSPSDIAKRYGLAKQHMSRAIQSLVNCGVLVRVGFNFRFVKDYERWTWKGESRFTESMIAEIRKAPKAAMDHKRKSVIKNDDESNIAESSNLVTDKQSSVIKNDDAESSNSITDQPINNTCVTKNGDEPSSNLMTSVTKFDDAAHYVEHARLRNGEMEKEREQFAPAHAREAIPNGRTGDDLRDWQEAIRILRSHKTTEKLADGLEMYADTPGVRQLAGWQIIQGARIVQQPHKSKDWPFFQGCCRQATREEFENWGKQISHPRNGKPPIRSDPLPPVFKAPPDWDHPSRRKGTA